MEHKFILQIQASYNQFTNAEKKVADYVVNNQEKVMFMSITDLADACHVGDTSVYRFCRNVTEPKRSEKGAGYDGECQKNFLLWCG